MARMSSTASSSHPHPPLHKPMRAPELVAALAKHYTPHGTALHYTTPWQLLVSIILSAQCTDARVNLTTPTLFKELPDMRAMREAPLTRIERLIFSTGFYKNKAKNIQAAACAILEEHGGTIPKTMEQLITIPGVGRKTANVYLNLIHHKAEGVVIDTHIFRVSRRTGVSIGTNAEQVERDVMRQLPRSQWILYGDLAIQHGRKICHARNPACAACPLKKKCPSANP